MNCLTCGNKITNKYAKKFCNRSCAAKFNGSKYPKRKKTSKQSTCLQCKNIFLYHEHASTGKFCSNKCCGIYRFENETIKRIENGESCHSETLKKYLSKTKGYKCEICNLNEWNKKEISLHVDHIDGNSDNNFPLNLRLLCPNCHSQTETFSGRNVKNSKRSSYMKRYRIKKINACLSNLVCDYLQ
jgi:hypothetical protein